MTKLYFSIVTATILCQLSPAASAQHSLTPSAASIINNVVPGSGYAVASTACNKDTVYYAYNRSTAFQGLNVVNTTSNGNGFCQWFPVPQSITVSGFDFFAWAPNAATAVTVTCNLYLAGPDSMPSGSPVRSVTVAVDSTFGGGMLSVLRKSAVFSSGYSTTSGNGYVVTIENSTTNPVSVVSNSWTNGNGATQWLSSIKFNNTWVRSYNVNVSSVSFNADFILMPHVNFTVAANFTTSNTCVSNNGTINFSSTSSAVLASPFYNRWTNFNLPQYSYYWDFGNGQSYAINPAHTYPSAANYTVSLVASLLGWTMSCNDTHSTNLFATPTAPTVGNALSVCAGDSIVLTAGPIAGGSFQWTGPNNFTANVKDTILRNVNSSHGGAYGVTVTLNGCKSQAATVNVTVNSVPSTPTASNNGPLCLGQDLELKTAAVSNASYEWTGPNSFSSTAQNPVVTNVSNANAGAYTVRIITNGCKSQPGSTTMSIGTAPSPPTLSTNAPLCTGQSLQLNASNSTNATYTWTGPASFTSSSQNPVVNGVTATNAGIYSCKVTVPGCGTSTNSTINVTITALPPAPVAGNNGPICVGNDLTLTATPVTGASYNWTGPSGYSSTDQNPVINSFAPSNAGTYSVTATVSGCGTSSAATTAVVLDPGPSTPNVSSNGPLCTGSTLSLQASTVSGATYQWTGPNGFSSTLQNPSISNAQTTDAGSYSVTAVIASCGASPPASINVAVNNIPNSPTISNNSPICSGKTLNLFAGNIPGATYQWSGPNSYTSTLQNPSISNATSANEGTYTVIAKVNGCSSPAVTIPVVVNTKPVSPVASKTGPACTGSDLNLTASSISNASYQWIGPNGFTSFIQNPTVQNLALVNSGVYSVTASVSNCPSDPATLNVNVTNKPVITNVLGQINSHRNTTENYSVPFTSGSVYNWQIVSGNQIGGGTTNAITVQWGDFPVGSVTVTETNVEGCAGDPYTANIGLWYTGIAKPISSNLNIYPNPVFNELNIENTGETLNAVLTNSVGTELKKVQLAKGVNKINMHDLPEGIYMLNFANGTNHKFLKIK